MHKQFPDRPVRLAGIDVHSLWINSKTLELAGIGAEHPDPVPGMSCFQRDPRTHEPTGWVVETFTEQQVTTKLDPPSPGALTSALTGVLRFERRAHHEKKQE